MDHGGGAVDQVTPGSHQLRVGAAHKLSPGEVGVGGFRAGNRDEITQRVSLVAAEHVTHINHDAVRGGELLALHG